MAADRHLQRSFEPRSRCLSSLVLCARETFALRRDLRRTINSSCPLSAPFLWTMPPNPTRVAQEPATPSPERPRSNPLLYLICEPPGQPSYSLSPTLVGA